MQLIEKEQAPGLYIARQWDNILFDVMLLGLAKAVGFAAAQRIAVSLCVLVFFWGVFAFISAVISTATLEAKQGKTLTIGNSTEGSLLQWLCEAGIEYGESRLKNPTTLSCA